MITRAWYNTETGSTLYITRKTYSDCRRKFCRVIDKEWRKDWIEVEVENEKEENK